MCDNSEERDTLPFLKPSKIPDGCLVAQCVGCAVMAMALAFAALLGLMGIGMFVVDLCTK